MTNGFRLVMTHGPEPGQTFTPDKDMIGIGRDPTNDIAIDHPQISRQHARLTRQGNIVVLQDLQSTNGTFVNGMRLTAPHTLANGDVIGLGDAVAFTYYGPAGELAPTMVSRKPATVRITPPPESAPAPYTPPPPSGVYHDEPPKKRRTGLWIGCGCATIVGLIIMAIVILVVLDSLQVLPPAFYRPLIWLGLDGLFS